MIDRGDRNLVEGFLDRPLGEAMASVSNTVAKGGTIIFIGHGETGRTAESAARQTHQYFVDQWMPGILTNFDENLNRLRDLATIVTTHDLKRENLRRLKQEQSRLKQKLRGVLDLDHLPDMLVVLDAQSNNYARIVQEAKEVGIPVAAIVEHKDQASRVRWAIVVDTSERLLYGNMIVGAALEGLKRRNPAERMRSGPPRDSTPTANRSDRDDSAIRDEFSPSETLVEILYEGLAAQHTIAGKEQPEALWQQAREMLAPRILESIASYAHRLRQSGRVPTPLITRSGEFDYRFSLELRDNIPFRIDFSRPSFFEQLQKELVDFLAKGGRISGKWGRLLLSDGAVEFVLPPSEPPTPKAWEQPSHVEWG